MLTEKERTAKSKALRDRDGGWVCHWCGNWGKTLDHLVPQSLGGTDDLWNLVLACLDCNSRRGHQIPTCGHPSCMAAIERQRIDNPLLAAVLNAIETNANAEVLGG